MRRKTYILWKRRVAITLAILLLSGLGYIYFRTGAFTLTTYTVTGASEEHILELKNGMALIAEQKLFKLLPGNRSISYHDDAIRTLIKETLPNTKTISIHPVNAHTLSIKLTSHTPLFSVSETHAISTDGTIYKEITPLGDLPRLTIASTTAVSSSVLMELSALIKNIGAVLFDVRYVSIDEHDDIRLYNDAQSTSIITTTKADMRKTWSNVLSAIDTDPLKSKLAKKDERLEYIDTRFGNKVFYKFTNGSTPDIIPPHATSTEGTTISQ